MKKHYNHRVNGKFLSSNTGTKGLLYDAVFDDETGSIEFVYENGVVEQSTLPSYWIRQYISDGAWVESDSPFKENHIVEDKTAKHYFECHITIEPVFGDRLARVEELSKNYKFKVADLFMQKRQEDSPERSKYDTFTTGHGKSYTELELRMRCLILDLKEEGFDVWRYKIEDTIIDSKINDELGILK